MVVRINCLLLDGDTLMGWNASRAATTRDAAAWTLVHNAAARQASGPAGDAPDVGPPPALPDAEAVCRQIATGHYENFSVISWLVPRSLRQDFANVYAFARWSDDLADESESPEAAGRALASWRHQLEDCGRGEARHPILVALADTIDRHQLTLTPFHNLLDAFEQDQRVVRYESREQLLEYCGRSANPVGRIVLALGGCRDPGRQAESDAICTGLQLVNFWQDIRRDRIAGRIYLPAEDMRRHRVVEADLDAPRASHSLRQLIAEEVAWAEACFAAGEPLVRRAPHLLRPAVAAFSGGGRAVAAAIRREGYDTLARRPVVSKAKKLSLAARALTGRLLASALGHRDSAEEAEQT
jgi:squalene synthase HpnC